MPAGSKVFNRAKMDIINGTIDLDTTATIKAMLLNTAFDASADNDADTVFVNDIKTPTDYESSGTGYTGGFGGAGRLVIAAGTSVINQDDVNDRAEWDNTADLTWTSINVGATGGTMIIYEPSGGADTNSPLIAWVKFTSDVTTNGGDFTVAWNAEGIITFT